MSATDRPVSAVGRPFPGIGLLGWVVLALTVAPLTACEDFSNFSASLAEARTTQAQPAAIDETSFRADAERWGEVYDKNPGEKVASINYARALRGLTRYKEAEAVMQAAAVKAPTDFEVLGAYGKALVDNGKYLQARDVLTRAYPADRPDWTILSVQGAVEDYLDDHGRAQQFYSEALKIAPGEPSILNNLGLSYALTHHLPLAETTLREAAASPRADVRERQNLALVLALEGKLAESERIGRKDVSKQVAAANARAIRTMIAAKETRTASLAPAPEGSRGRRRSSRTDPDLAYAPPPPLSGGPQLISVAAALASEKSLIPIAQFGSATPNQFVKNEAPTEKTPRILAP